MKRVLLKTILAGPGGSRQPGEYEVSNEEAKALIAAGAAVAVEADEPEPEPKKEAPEVETTEAKHEGREEATAPKAAKKAAPRPKRRRRG